MRHLYITLLCLAALAPSWLWASHDAHAAHEHLLTNSRHINITDGLPCNQIFDMAQDAHGFIWIATANGLCRYDGYQFYSFYDLGTTGMHAALGFVNPDDDGRHVWMQTSTYQFACYDTQEGRFVDFTGRGDDHHSYRKFVKNKGVMWMFDDESGVRRIKASADGVFDCRDYTQQQGSLPHNRVNDAVMGDDGRAWIMTNGGLTEIGADGKARNLSTLTGYRRALWVGKRLLALTTQNEIHVFGSDGRLLLKRKVEEKVPVVTSSFEWRNRWMLMTKGATFSVEPTTGRLTRDAEHEVVNGFVMYAAEGNYFVSDPLGSFRLYRKDGSIRQFDFMTGAESTVDRVRRYNITRDSDGRYYIASHGNGLFVYDDSSGHVQHYSASDARPLIGSNYLNNVLIDRSGCIWVGEDLTGLNCIMPPSGMNVHYHYPNAAERNKGANYVKMVRLTNAPLLSIGTRDNRLYHLNPTSGDITLQGELPAAIYAELKDSRGHTWQGTRGNGLYIDGQQCTDFPAQHIFDIKEDERGRLWIATWGEGLFMVHLDDDGHLSTQQLMKRSYNESLLRALVISNDQRLWIATNNGAYSLNLRATTVSNDSLKCSNMANGRLPFDEVICMLCDSKGRVWLGSRGGGLLYCKTSDGLLTVEKALTQHEGMPSNNVYSLVEDQQQHLWVGTDNGVSTIDGGRKGTLPFVVNNYLPGQTTQDNICTENCAVLMDNGSMAFGTLSGLLTLRPEPADTTHHSTLPPPIVSAASINGISHWLSPDEEQLDVNHDQNAIVLSFTTLDFAHQRSTQYQYYMEGVNKTWLPLTGEHQAHYNGLPPGTYRFHLRAFGQGGQWSEARVFTIHIRQPWYNTWWAWILWLMLASSLVAYILHTLKRIIKLHQQIKMQRELSNFRLNFYTHIVHEFRTPLAIISGAAEKLTPKTEGRRMGESDEQVSQQAVQTVRRGTRRLSKLVNQLMEFRKINTGSMRLALTRADIIRLARTAFDEFRDLAEKKEQRLVFSPFARQHEMTIDPHLVETILYNLLSNAVKYTPQKGTITLKMRQEGEQLLIIVEDDGPGISAQQVPQLYQPFMHGYVSQGGMGIGLYTAYQSAVIHKGSIAYERVAEAGGSRFTVTLPATEAPYASDDYASSMAVDTTSDKQAPLVDIREMLPEAYNDYIVAIIEDDPDMQEQVNDTVRQFFKTVCYDSGETAIAGLQAQPADLILCDIMLPDITGYEVVKRLRSLSSAADTPIIMLTALDGDDHILRGYKAGADEYMVKPCNYELLLLRISQLIKWHERHRVNADEQAAVSAQQVIITDEGNQRFKEKVEAIVSRKMGDPSFTIDLLAAQLKMGRTKFYGKMKELTGMSPNAYLQSRRLEKAAQLLIEGDLNVTEISYKVGFQAPAYFYKCFKEKYGVAPSKYGKG